MMLRRNARAFAFYHLSKGSDVRGSSPATTADKIDPAVIDKALDSSRHAFGSLEIYAVLVRQSRIRYARHASLRQLGEASNAIGHELGPRCAVQAYRQQIGVHH